MHDDSTHSCTFEDGDLVHVLNFRPGEKWIPGKIIESTGPIPFRIQLQNGHIVRRHQDHLRHWMVRFEQVSAETASDENETLTNMTSVGTLAETTFLHRKHQIPVICQTRVHQLILLNRSLPATPHYP